MAKNTITISNESKNSLSVTNENKTGSAVTINQAEIPIDEMRQPINFPGLPIVRESKKTITITNE